MLFKKAADVPKEISDSHITEWYSSLSDQDKVKLKRYLKGAGTSAYAVLSSVADAAIADENYQFAASVCEECLRHKLTDMEKFSVTESLIESYVQTKRYDEAKDQCERNLRLFPSVKDIIRARNNGSLPEKLNCRNRYVDVVVGIESGYDEAFRLLDRFFEMGLIGEEELAYRRQSLKIRRLQRSFEGVFTYTYKD